MNPNIPEKCKACDKPLLLENLFVDDGCPCNSARGVNFKPQYCSMCKVENCVKPAHRIEALFGSVPIKDSALEVVAFEQKRAWSTFKKGEEKLPALGQTRDYIIVYLAENYWRLRVPEGFMRHFLPIFRR